MIANMETLDGLKRRLTLKLDLTAFEAEVNKRLGKVAHTVRMDGFRPGKAPKKTDCCALFHRDTQRIVWRDRE